jgi:hypothetical protein
VVAGSLLAAPTFSKVLTSFGKNGAAARESTRGSPEISAALAGALTFNTCTSHNQKVRDFNDLKSDRHHSKSKIRQPDVGLEPTTLRLRVSRATDCASRACCYLMNGNIDLMIIYLANLKRFLPPHGV